MAQKIADHSSCVSMPGPPQQLGIGPGENARIRIVLVEHRHPETIGREPRYDFLHREILRVSVVFVGEGRREHAEHAELIIFADSASMADS
jgi:hypothetical protein